MERRGKEQLLRTYVPRNSISILILMNYLIPLSHNVRYSLITMKGKTLGEMTNFIVARED